MGLAFLNLGLALLGWVLCDFLVLLLVFGFWYLCARVTSCVGCIGVIVVKFLFM